MLKDIPCEAISALLRIFFGKRKTRPFGPGFL
jgi:hypothetical protein